MSLSSFVGSDWAGDFWPFQDRHDDDSRYAIEGSFYSYERPYGEAFRFDLFLQHKHRCTKCHLRETSGKHNGYCFLRSSLITVQLVYHTCNTQEIIEAFEISKIIEVDD